MQHSAFFAEEYRPWSAGVLASRWNPGWRQATDDTLDDVLLCNDVAFNATRTCKVTLPNLLRQRHPVPDARGRSMRDLARAAESRAPDALISSKGDLHLCPWSFTF